MSDPAPLFGLRPPRPLEPSSDTPSRGALEPLSALRQAAPWRARFVEQSPHLWPLAQASAPFAAHCDWPLPEELDQAFRATGQEQVVCFRQEASRPRRGRRHPAAHYDAAIVDRRVVPTRHRSWHDLLNALVWATFPRAKLALHDRQRRAGEARRARGEQMRDRQEDTLAMLDEGGLLLVGGEPLLFGHALYEHLVLGGRALTVRTVALPPLPASATIASPQGVVSSRYPDGAGARSREATCGPQEQRSDRRPALVVQADLELARLLADDRQLHHPELLGRVELQG